MAESHFKDLCECLLNEPEGWFARMFDFNSPEALHRTILGSIKANQESRGLAFVVRDLNAGRVAGFSNLEMTDFFPLGNAGITRFTAFLIPSGLNCDSTWSKLFCSFLDR